MTSELTIYMNCMLYKQNCRKQAGVVLPYYYGAQQSATKAGSGTTSATGANKPCKETTELEVFPDDC